MTRRLQPARLGVVCASSMLLATLLFTVAQPARTHAAAALLRVIVNPNVPTSTLNRADIEAIFKRQERIWKGDGPVIPFNYDVWSPTRRTFDEAVMGMAPSDAHKYWVDTLVRGGPQPPRIIDNPLLVARLVARLPGAIGYVEDQIDSKGTKIVARIRNGSVVPP